MKKILLLTMLYTLTLQGCAPILIGGAATGASVANDRRTAGRVVDDKALQLSIASRIENIKRLSQNSHVNVTVYNGLVLLTGEAFNQNIKDDIATVAQRTEGTKRLVNDIIIGPRSNLLNRSYDAKQTLKVKTALLSVNLPNFNPNRVKVVTEHGVTYLLGILSEQESQIVVDIARRVSGVAQVVSLFEIDNNVNAAKTRLFTNDQTYSQELRNTNTTTYLQTPTSNHTTSNSYNPYQ